jgi:hypothetical protein
MGDHGEEAALGAVGGVGLAPFPFPVGEGFQTLLERVDVMPARGIDPAVDQAHAKTGGEQQRQRSETDVKNRVAIHRSIPPPADP